MKFFALIFWTLAGSSSILAQEFKPNPAVRLQYNRDFQSIEVISPRVGHYQHFLSQNDTLLQIPFIHFNFRQGDRLLGASFQEQVRNILVINDREVIYLSASGLREVLWRAPSAHDLEDISMLDYDPVTGNLFYLRDAPEISRLYVRKGVKETFLGKVRISIESIRKDQHIYNAQIFYDARNRIQWINGATGKSREVIPFAVRIQHIQLQKSDASLTAVMHESTATNVHPNFQDEQPMPGSLGAKFAFETRTVALQSIDGQDLVDAGLFVPCESYLSNQQLGNFADIDIDFDQP